MSAARKKGTLRVGTSGYQYDHWRGVFYPRELPKSRWFEHYASRFDTVEINNTFYQLPAEESFDRWCEAAPEGFCYALKYSRYGSHVKKLKDPRAPIQLFLGRARRLEDHLGPILVQLPPRWHADTDRLAAFLRAAPRSQRWVLEFRDRSWLCDRVFELLERHGAALCLHDMIEGHPRRLTTDWTYLRFHGVAYGGCYSHQLLAAEARRIREYLDRGMDVFAYFNNDREGFAIRNAMQLRRYVSG